MDTGYCLCFILCVIQLYFVEGQRLVSLNKKITASSTYQLWEPKYVVDGNMQRNAATCKCCASTNLDDSPWFKLDLGGIYLIERIDVLGRNDLEHCARTNYGQDCQQRCLCLTGGCDQSSGVCQNQKCMTGYDGERCDHCARTYYGQNCHQRCFCLTGYCDQLSGVCHNQGCTAGYEGERCDYCARTHFGQSCEKRCLCLTGGCNQSSGVCQNQGCVAGYEGDKCDIFTEGDQTSSPVLPILGAAVGVFTILVIIAVVIIIIQTRRVSRLQKKQDTKQNEKGNNRNANNEMPRQIDHISQAGTQYEELDQIQLEIPHLDYETMKQDSVHYQNTLNDC